MHRHTASIIASLITALILLMAPMLASAQDYTVQSTLWVDANENGVREANEGTLAGTTVTLMYVGADGVALTADDQKIEQSTVSSGGSDIAAGSIRFTLGGGGVRYYLAILNSDKPRGYTPTLDHQGSAATDSNLMSGAGQTAWATDTFTIDYGQLITGIDLGLRQVQFDHMVVLPLIAR